MTQQVYIAVITPGGTLAKIGIVSDSERLLDLLFEAVCQVLESFDVVEKADAVREFESIVYDAKFRQLREVGLE